MTTSRYIPIVQSDDLPLLDRELIYITPGEIIYSYEDVESYIKKIDFEIIKQISLELAFKESVSQPRFNLSSYFYNINLNSKINILPDFTTNFTTVDLFDRRAIELYEVSKRYENTYVFWSGGIDSTLILCSILKNWDNIENISIVLNQNSIEENPKMYEQHIKNRIKIVNTNDFLDKKIHFTNRDLYVSGDLGDPLITFDGYQNFRKMFPGICDEPWKTNTQKIIDYFNHGQKTNNGRYALYRVIKSFTNAQIHPVTVHDFFWWINFNWGWDDFIFLWSYHDIDYELDLKQFVEENMFHYFNTNDCQNWAVGLIGTGETNKDNISKYPFKQYIYDFNHDLDYFKYKDKEFSGIKNRQMLQNKTIMAVDTEYNLYYRENFKVKPYY